MVRLATSPTWKERKGGGGQITRKNGHICVFVSLKPAHPTVVHLHEGGEHYEGPFRYLIRQRLPPLGGGRVEPAKEVPTEKRADFFLSIWHTAGTTTRHQYQPPRRPRGAPRPAGMAGQIAEACLAVTSQRVPHKFSPAALRAS